MLLKRLRINNPSAQFRGIGELKKYKLGFFGGDSNLWHGAPVTIVDSEESSVWGVVWELSKNDEDNLDRQESGYKSIYVNIESPSLGIVKCKSYQKLLETVADGTPSLIYKRIMIEGAKDHGLPDWYVKKLEDIPDNGYKGNIDIDVNIKI
ncbi:hypothetical protein JTE90_027976 [Oedothorax gibbosus]|uniref:gamma-glutamylcyclotransferase n=1 Tax=Oedothorax gibbosus TaxID=931172 RepID=A0AAV6VF14_9ARAC|nr:hypothetical protein JTE90_027976 [Oedothorax gibbosus]